MTPLKLLISSAFSFALLSSCSEEDGNRARLEIRLTDAPGDYQEVNIDIQGVQVHSENTDNGSGWKSLDISPGVYNLLELTNGLDTLLGAVELPAGRISQVRLILGDDNTLKINGERKFLTTPSAQQSGLKLNVQQNLVEGIAYTLLLDFDAARSIVRAGASGKYLLKPVIRAVTEATSGAVAGTLSEPLAKPAVYAIIANDTLGTTFANDEGKFLIKGLQPGTYTISFSPATGYTINDINGVVITLGKLTTLGEVTVEE
jgi:hypothetical protein